MKNKTGLSPGYLFRLLIFPRIAGMAFTLRIVASRRKNLHKNFRKSPPGDRFSAHEEIPACRFVAHILMTNARTRRQAATHSTSNGDGCAVAH